MALIVLGAEPATAGFNEDGNIDAVFANSSPLQNDQVCLGNGDGVFECSDIISNSSRSSAVALEDVDDDGNLDAVFANFNRRNRVCLGNGFGGFECSDVSDLTLESQDVALGDLNGDGNIDAVFANDRSLSRDDTNQACLGDGFGNFECNSVSLRMVGSFGVALGDVNNDDYLDAVFAEDGLDSVCLGDGLGRFDCGTHADAENFDLSLAVALGYVDGDDNLDAVFANFPSQRNRVCLGNGSGEFTCNDVSEDDDLSSFSNAVALGDVDNDGKLDAVFANLEIDNGRNRVCLGDGDGVFECGDVSMDESRTADVALAFVDMDENLDAVFANEESVVQSQLRNRLCRGNGAGGFECADISQNENRTAGIALTDTDLDRVQDNEDECIPSDIRQTVWIDGEDTAVDNDLTDTAVPTLFDSTLGCTVADLVRETAKMSLDRADFLRNLQVVVRELTRQRTLTPTESLTISTAAAEANLP